ncbi:MAG: tetratricopeptide repeat protein, partial [Pseudomonadota bacterium]
MGRGQRRATADAIARVTAEAPDFALGHAFKGHLLLLLGRSELVAPARAALAAAHAATARTPQMAPARTAAVVAALEAYLAGFPRRAAVILGAWLEDNPGDMLLTKLDHQIRFLMGDRRGMLAMTTRAMAVVSEADAGDDPLHGYRLGAHAFALEENGHYAEAEAAGRAGLERASD